ncbi:hypothetical protein Xbed_01182 [Xenorhabdus beddingii]|uniref:Type VI secretion system tube protein Hcp n=1 Tax=Xenorhabdus beddingii TaxID=40578 RepID=A0A1Y2SPJ5_9GAMM|nr:type VI secretion system tube protein Hcp [Xenorhabdus beddingii]OTA20654.1 hypothetical protein Xbed_01182 [Xenorhabdus beddingii]
MSEPTCGYLEIKDIKGESRHTKYKDWIAVVSIEHTISNESSISQKQGLCAGTPFVNEIALKILYDKSSTALRGFLFKGKHAETAKLVCLRSSSGDEEVPFYTFDMKKVLITACHTNYTSLGPGKSVNDIFIKLSFEEYTENYIGQKFDGTAEAAISCGYNVSTKVIT